MWTKTFTDNSSEHGADADILAGKASWSKGRLDNIRDVQLTFNFWISQLLVPNTTWHQFDRFQVDLSIQGKQSPYRTHRVIQAEVKPHHVGKQLIARDIGKRFIWVGVQDTKVGKNYFLIKPILNLHVGKWISIVLPDNKRPSVGLSLKGSINDNKYISR